MKFRWSVTPPQSLLAAELAHRVKVTPLLAQCLINRGLSDTGQVQQFLEPRLRDLSDPFLLPDMSMAVQRLFLARERQEKLVIFGDYDVDGVTSTALLTEVFTRLGWHAGYYLPHRFDEGYGLTVEAVQNCINKCPATLVVAVDCGSTAVATVDWLKSQGIDVIVVDHHQTCSPAPAVCALINPHRHPPSRNDLRELCSVGLAFKLAHAIVKAGRQTGLAGATEFDLRPLLDLVALGTVADLVPLTGENRILVTSGLEHLNGRKRPGLQSLAAVAGVQGQIGVYEIAFQLAPRLNAAGRLENALAALDLLLAKDIAVAEVLAQRLDTQNRERQKIERAIADQVIGAVRAKFNPAEDYVIVEGELLWHLGVVGIVASRVVREFYRPTIIIGGDSGLWRGSGRSIEGFDLAAALRSCGDLLTRHGGHAMAAGLSLTAENLAPLRKRLNQIARQTLPRDLLQPALRIDSETALDQITRGLLCEISRLEPIGQANPPVQLVAHGLRQYRAPQRLGKSQQHVKMWVTDGNAVHSAVGWNWPPESVPTGEFSLVFHPQLNCYRGQEEIQLKILDWRPSSSPSDHVSKSQ